MTAVMELDTFESPTSENVEPQLLSVCGPVKVTVFAGSALLSRSESAKNVGVMACRST